LGICVRVSSFCGFDHHYPCGVDDPARRRCRLEGWRSLVPYRTPQSHVAVGVFGGGDMVAARFQFDDEFFDEGGFYRFRPPTIETIGAFGTSFFFRNNGARVINSPYRITGCRYLFLKRLRSLCRGGRYGFAGVVFDIAVITEAASSGSMGFGPQRRFSRLRQRFAPYWHEDFVLFIRFRAVNSSCFRPCRRWVFHLLRHYRRLFFDDHFHQAPSPLRVETNDDGVLIEWIASQSGHRRSRRQSDGK